MKLLVITAICQFIAQLLFDWVFSKFNLQHTHLDEWFVWITIWLIALLFYFKGFLRIGQHKCLAGLSALICVFAVTAVSVVAVLYFYGEILQIPL